MPKKLTDAEREFKRKERNRNLLNRYNTYDDGLRGSPENWKKISEIVFGSHDTFKDSLKSLGLESTPATKEDLKVAWKKTMSNLHPDKMGGDAELATQANQAYAQLKKYFATGQAKPKTQTNVIGPAKASHIEHEDFDLLWVDKKYMNHNFIAEKKSDGSRYLLYLEQESMLLSRRTSDVTGEYVDKTLNCPHLTRKSVPQELLGTTLDGEMVHPSSEKSDDTTSIMGCSPDEAVRRQELHGWLIYRVYDIPRYKGRDLRQLPFRERREILEEAVRELSGQIPIEIQPQVPHHGAKALFENLVAAGGEGIMLKDLNATYGKGWFKVKKFKTWDCIILGYEAPKKTSKKVDGTVSETQFHKNKMIGAVRYGMYVDGVLTEIGTCSGMSVKVRQELSVNGPSYLGKVIEIKGQERTKTGAVRHARFLKFREDKAAAQCIDDGR